MVILQVDNAKIEQLRLPTDAFLRCWEAGIDRVGDLRCLGPAGVLRLDGVGPATLRQVEAALGTWAPIQGPPSHPAHDYERLYREHHPDGLGTDPNEMMAVLQQYAPLYGFA